MGSPLRFFGSGVAQAFDDVVIPARCTVEVTVRTFQQRFLLRPDARTTEILLGCLGRACHRYPGLNLHAISALSNHTQFLATPDEPWVLSSFMRDFLSTSAKQLNEHLGRDGTFWERRYRAIPILDEATVEDRFRYVLTQGTKENLVASARDWPGIQCIDALLGGPELVGRWRDRSAECERDRQRQRRLARAAARGQPPRKGDSRADAPRWINYPIQLVPLPHWQRLRPGQFRARVAAIVREDDQQTAARHRRDGTRPLGAPAILAADPFARPARSARSPAPLCHAASRAGRTAFRVAYRLFVNCVRGARVKLAGLLPAVGFPPGATAPPIPITCGHVRIAGGTSAAAERAKALLDRATGPPLPRALATT